MTPAILGSIAAQGILPEESSLPPVGAHRYWGLRMVAGVSGQPYCAVGDIIFAVTPGASRTHTNPGKIVGPAVGLFGNTPQQSIVDRAGAYGWLESNAGFPYVAGYDFDSPIAIVQARVMGHWHPDRLPMAVKDYDIIYADSDPAILASWTSAAEIRGKVWLAVDETQTISIPQ